MSTRSRVFMASKALAVTAPNASRERPLMPAGPRGQPRWVFSAASQSPDSWAHTAGCAETAHPQTPERNLWLERHTREELRLSLSVASSGLTGPVCTCPPSDLGCRAAPVPLPPHSQARLLSLLILAPYVVPDLSRCFWAFFPCELYPHVLCLFLLSKCVLFSGIWGACVLGVQILGVSDLSQYSPPAAWLPCHVKCSLASISSLQKWPVFMG